MGIPARQQIAGLFQDVPTEHHVQKVGHTQSGGYSWNLRQWVKSVDGVSPV
jgi:hypothetical protein